MNEESHTKKDEAKPENPDAKPNDEKHTSLGQIGQLAALLAILALISIGTIATIVKATNHLTGGFRPEVVLPILLVAGLIALVMTLAILVGTFSIFGLNQQGAAFGVPEGTLQAVIAMMIIMIFAITSLYLNASLDTKTVVLTGITQAQLSAIPADELVSSARQEPGTDLFDVTRIVKNQSTVQEDFAKQLLTTLSTLVVAIVGFYFGAKSVETGVRTQKKAADNTAGTDRETENL